MPDQVVNCVNSKLMYYYLEIIINFGHNCFEMLELSKFFSADFFLYLIQPCSLRILSIFHFYEGGIVMRNLII